MEFHKKDVHKIEYWYALMVDWIGIANFALLCVWCVVFTAGLGFFLLSSCLWDSEGYHPTLTGLAFFVVRVQGMLCLYLWLIGCICTSTCTYDLILCTLCSVVFVLYTVSHSDMEKWLLPIARVKL